MVQLSVNKMLKRKRLPSTAVFAKKARRHLPKPLRPTAFDIFPNVPANVIEKVVNSLGCEDLLRASVVCKSWADRLNTDVVWRRICQAKALTRDFELTNGLDAFIPTSNWQLYSPTGYEGVCTPVEPSRFCAWRKYHRRCATAARRILKSHLPPAFIFHNPSAELIHNQYLLEKMPTDGDAIECSLTSVQSGRILIKTKLPTSKCKVVHSPCRRYVAFLHENGFKVINVRMNTEVLTKSTKGMMNACFTTSRFLVSTNGQHIECYLFDFKAPPALIRTPCQLINYRVSGEQVISWNQSFWMYVINPATGDIFQLKNTNFVKQVEFYKDRYVITLDESGTRGRVSVWDLKQLSVVQQVEVHLGSKFAVCNNMMLVSCATASTALWLLRFNVLTNSFVDVWNSHGIDIRLRKVNGRPSVAFIDPEHFIVDEYKTRVCQIRIVDGKVVVRSRKIVIPEANVVGVGATPSQLLFRCDTGALIVMDFDYQKT